MGILKGLVFSYHELSGHIKKKLLVYYSENGELESLDFFW